MKEIKTGTIAVIGTKEQVLPFLAIGAEVFITDDINEARKALINFAEDMHPVILISDDMMQQMEDIISKYSSVPVPSITALPGKSGKASFSNERLNSMIKKAIGIDIAGLN